MSYSQMISYPRHHKTTLTWTSLNFTRLEKLSISTNKPIKFTQISFSRFSFTTREDCNARNTRSHRTARMQNNMAAFIWVAFNLRRIKNLEGQIWPPKYRRKINTCLKIGGLCEYTWSPKLYLWRLLGLRMLSWILPQNSISLKEGKVNLRSQLNCTNNKAISPKSLNSRVYSLFPQQTLKTL